MRILGHASFFAFFIQICSSYRILSLIPFSGKSHYIGMQPIMRELAERGHEVTVLTVYEEENPPENYKQIVADKKMFWDYIGTEPNIFALEQASFRDMINLAWDAMYFTNEAVLNSTSVREFIKNDKSHYDLIIAEVFYQESLYMFAHKYNAPLVGISTNGYNLFSGHFMGNPNILACMTHEFVKYRKDLTFTERMSNTFAYWYDLFWREYYLLPKHQKIAEEIFGPGPLPLLSDIEKNMSLLLINSHFSYDTVRPLVPGIVEIGGSHIKKSKALPKNIQQFLDDAKDGAIFFSFGSNVKSKDMPREKIDIFLNAFKRIKQRVVWKFEDDNIAAILPSNVIIGKWLPQNDILAHPNVKLFITHGGLLSMQEAMYHGVPLLGFPFFGDQFLNLKNVKNLGYGTSLLYSSITEDTLYNTLYELISNPSYSEKAKQLSRRFNDRPLSAMNTAIFWIEYVIRNKGAPYMKSPISNLTTLEYYMLDILALILVCVVFSALSLYIITVFLVKLILGRKNKSKRNKKDKNK